MKNTPFILSEGALALPGAWQDCSINVLRFPQQAATLAITRAWDVKPEEDERYLGQQLEKVKQRMKKFTAGEPQDCTLGGHPAREVALQFQSGQGPVYEKLAIARIDEHLLVFTLSRMAPFDDEAEAFWAAIKAGLQAEAQP